MSRGPADPYARWVAEQERIRRRRRTRFAAASAAGGVLVAAVAAGAMLYTGDGKEDGAAGAATGTTTGGSAPRSGEPVPSVVIESPSGAPSSLPALLKRPIVTPEQAFPEANIRLADGAAYERVELATTTDCARGMSARLAELIEQGEECAQLTAALFTDSERRSQVTVTVLSFERAEDASRVFMMASMDPVTYQVVSLDPPPEAGLPTVPPGSAGVFRRLMTVRSVVFASGQWDDGADTDEAALTEQTTGLLTYVNEKVVAHEDGSDGN